jgi:AraC-like DNA-binding protein
MILENCKLSENLTRHIESILYIKDFTPEHSIERVVPTGHIFIIFELDDITRHTFHNKSLKVLNEYSKVWVSGTHRNFISISAHQDSEMLVIQFKPTGSYPYLHFPVYEISDKVVSAEEIFGEEIWELRHTILQAATPHEKLNIAADWLTDRFDSRKEVPEYLLRFVERLEKEAVSNLNEIIGAYPYTQKQLIQHFKKYIGITPKYYHRILRFNEIMKMINKEEKVSWSYVAHNCDYSDQSHFIKEFFLFSGFNPREFIKMDFSKDDTNFFPLDKKG